MVITGVACGLIKVQPGSLVRLINACASSVSANPLSACVQPVVELGIQLGTRLGGGGDGPRGGGRAQETVPPPTGVIPA